MKIKIIVLCFSFLFCISANSQTCKDKYKLNAKDFLSSTQNFRKEQNYDEIIRILNDSIKKDSTEIWPYYQLACTYSLKGDTILPFKYLYKYIDLKEFADDIFSDSDFDKLFPTYSWKCLKDTIRKAYLSKYPNIKDPDLSIKLWEYGIYDQMYRTLDINNKRQITIFDSVVLQKVYNSFLDIIEHQTDYVYGLLDKGIIPTYSMVGKEASDAFVIIFKHNHRKELTKKKLKLLYKAALKKEITVDYYTYVYDYWLIQKGKKQLYGSQVGQIVDYDKKGKAVIVRSFFSPIEDEKNVNKRRIELGLSTIEEYAKKMDMDYKYDPEFDKKSTNKAYKKLREINAEARKRFKKEIEESSK